MKKQGVGNTAVGAAICRLIEQYQPRELRLFYDPVVKALVGTTIRSLLRCSAVRRYTIKRMDAVAKGIYGGQVCRTRFIDDTIQDALQAGVEQVLILGAGLDTRPYRLPGIERTGVFEVDLRVVQKTKRRRLKKHLGRLPRNVSFVPIDFLVQTLDAVLSKTSFDRRKETVVIWEGVTQYIPESAVRQTFSFIGSLAAGSVLIFTYVLKSIIEGHSANPDAANLMNYMAKNDAPWVFGLEPLEVEAYLGAFGLKPVADVTSDDYQQRYLRPLRRQLFTSDGEHTVQAVVGVR